MSIYTSMRALRLVFVVLCLCIACSMSSASASTPGLRAYFVHNMSGVNHLGHINWTQYDHVEQVDQINWVNKRDHAFHADGPTTNFAVRLVGTIDIPQSGVWSFYLGSDDGSVLLIDGEVVIEQPYKQSYRTRTNFAILDAGEHEIEVRYFQGPGHAGLVLEWDGPGSDGRELIPASAFSSPAAEPTPESPGDGLWVYWYDNARHASNVGHIDWNQADQVETVQMISYARTRGAFRVDGPVDSFGARFMGVIEIDEPGEWRFELGSDQSAILFIDGDPVVVDDAGHSYRWRSGTKTLGIGEYTIEVRYWEGSGDAGLAVAWKAPSASYATLIPPSAFRPGIGATNPSSAGGLRVYNHDSARHASNVGQVDWGDHDSVDTVQNIYYPRTSGSFEPAGPSDYFAKRYVGKINIPRSGTWTFGLGSDQSARLSIDGVAVVNDASGHSFRWRHGSKSLSAGLHDIEVQYWEGYGDAGLAVSWQGPGDDFEQIIPASVLSQNDVDPVLNAGGEGLRVYWVDNARHAQHAGHIDWQNYDRMTFESNIAWEITRNPFAGTTITNDEGVSTSQGGTKSDYFGLRAEGLIQIPAEGEWRFGLGSDQSAQLFIDGQLVVNDLSGHSFRWNSGTIELEPGLYPFEVRYWEGYGDSGLLVSWTPPGGVEEVIPASAFSHSEIETPYDAGGGGVRAYWTTNARHAGNAGQIDWDRHDHATTIQNIAYRKTQEAFDSQTPSDYFGLRVLGQIDIPAGGEWRFGLGSDQSAMVLIDGEAVVVDTSGHSYRWRHGTTQLSAGKHDIEIRFWDGYGDAGLHLSWSGPTVPAEIIVPRTALSLRETETPTQTGGGLRAYWTSNARHAGNAGQIDYAEHSSTTIVDNVSWQKTRSAFFMDGPADYFGLRLISRLTIPEEEGGLWTFGLGSDQSAILLIDDEPVVVDTSGHSYRWRSGTIQLTPGEHKFEVRYWEGYGDAGLHASWRGPNDLYEEIIPASAFDAYETDPVFDPGEAALATEWYRDTRGFSIDSYAWESPIKTTTEARVSWNKTRSAFSADVPADYFAARISGTLNVPQTGTWTFRVGSDQYARLLIDGSTVVDDTSGHSFRWRSGEIMLQAGEHELVLEFMEGYGDAGLFLTWQGPDDLFEEVIPASAFVPKSERVRVVQWREIGGGSER
ncbi:MAG: PA14 domain-containing protein [Phycisphaerales bacterium]